MTHRNDTSPPPSSLEVALDLIRRRGGKPVPVPFGKKKAVLDAWQELRITEEDASRYFNGKAQNVGLLVGEPSGGLVDVDLDVPEAVKLAPHFLPVTHAIFGRASNPTAHRLYIIAPVVPTAQFRSPEGDMLLELRSTGAQTVMPGSYYRNEDGRIEPIVWHEDEDALPVEGRRLLLLVRILAAATLFARAWPDKGGRHIASLALAGGLLRAGWTETQVTHFVRGVALASGDEETEDRVRSAAYTSRRLAGEQAATGWPKLAELVGEATVRKAREWLQLSLTDNPVPTLNNTKKSDEGLDDDVEKEEKAGEAQSEDKTARVSEAWELCKELAREPEILRMFAVDLKKGGYSGDTKAAELIYLSATSRFLDRPVSLAVKGPSSAGKSHTVERTLSFFPDDSYYALTAMSEKALVYSKEPLKHRMMVIYEAAGLNGDFASYLMRSLLSEGKVRYETVEKTGAGMRPRLIEREGPTGLIVTTTAPRLHPENETRLLSIWIGDSQEQTKDILLALADESRRPDDAALPKWLALQTWLTLAGERRVTVPFGRVLAGLIPPLAVRLRRDVTALLNLIRAHAILHQATRPKDAHGAVVATLDDYGVVRALVYDIIAEGIEAAVSKTVRETVEAVKELCGSEEGKTPSVSQLARKLGLDKSSVSNRVAVCLEKGYLRNLEADGRKGKSYKLVVGDPLPEDVQILPSRENLLTAIEALPEEEKRKVLGCWGPNRRDNDDTVVAATSSDTANYEIVSSATAPQHPNTFCDGTPKPHIIQRAEEIFGVEFQRITEEEDLDNFGSDTGL